MKRIHFLSILTIITGAIILILLNQNPIPFLFLGILILFLLYSLWNPPKKQKDFSLSDQHKATIRALGGSGVPDISQLKPINNRSKDKKKRKKKRKHIKK